jgi:hypothetical protein
MPTPGCLSQVYAIPLTYAERALVRKPVAGLDPPSGPEQQVRQNVLEMLRQEQRRRLLREKPWLVKGFSDATIDRYIETAEWPAPWTGRDDLLPAIHSAAYEAATAAARLAQGGHEQTPCHVDLGSQPGKFRRRRLDGRLDLP